MITLNQLEKEAAKFLNEVYGINLDVPIIINGRLKKSKGRFVSQTDRRTRESKALRVEMNKQFIESNKYSTVIDVLKHELVHYALFMKNKPNSDGHPVFEGELRRLGIVSQSTIENIGIVSRVQKYQCKSCDKEFIRTIRLRGDISRYSCSCGGGLIDKGKVEMVL